MNNLPSYIIESIYSYTDEKKNIQNYYKNNILTKIDTSLFKLNYNCFACYYRIFLLKENINECIFGEHIIKKEKWFSCHLLPIANPNGELLKLYDIVNHNIELFLIIYRNKKQQESLIYDLYYYFRLNNN